MKDVNFSTLPLFYLPALRKSKKVRKFSHNFLMSINEFDSRPHLAHSHTTSIQRTQKGRWLTRLVEMPRRRLAINSERHAWPIPLVCDASISLIEYNQLQIHAKIHAHVQFCKESVHSRPTLLWPKLQQALYCRALNCHEFHFLKPSSYTTTWTHTQAVHRHLIFGDGLYSNLCS